MAIVSAMDTRCVYGVDTDDEVSDYSASTELKTKLDQQYYKSLDGFLMVITKDGDIIFVSENIEKYLGLTQVCLLYGIRFMKVCDRLLLYSD